jgi:hypothetical protein
MHHEGIGIDDFSADGIQKKNGPQSAVVTLTFDLSGMVAKMNISAAKEVKEQSEILDALSQSEIRYRRLFEAAHDGVLIMISRSGRIRGRTIRHWTNSTAEPRAF